jgi:DNA modification methylase
MQAVGGNAKNTRRNLNIMNIDGMLHGNDLFGQPLTPKVDSPVKQKFIIAPFSILNTREGDWQDRKRKWLALGIKSEVGRSENLMNLSNAVQAFDRYRGIEAGESTDDQKLTGTSVFDPVLCELMYRWFCKPGGQIIDPFSGGSVRGVIAGLLGFKYWGCDLREEQINANIEQGKELLPDAPPTWVCGDSRETIDGAPRADFLFSCPPYGDLEVYSKNPKDLSNMEWAQFKQAYCEIIYKAVGRLRDNRFACFVVSEIRDDKGHYRNFVGLTVQAFIDAGCRYYNEAILVNSIGTLPIRINGYFNGSRKMGRTHQNILIFAKGSAEIAAAQVIQ